MISAFVNTAPGPSFRCQPKTARRGVAHHLVELDDLTESAIEQVIMAAVESYQEAGSERQVVYVNGGGISGDTAAADAGTGLNGAVANVAVNRAHASGSWSEERMSDSSYTPSPDSAEFAEAAREEAHNTAMRNSKDVVRAILETENSDDEEYRSRKLSALLAAAILAAAEKKAGQS